MDLLHLKYFQTVARLEHMTKAAEELNITQPSLSIMIGRLEEKLGIPLFDRQGRSIRLNQFGKAYLEYVNRVFQELEQGERVIRDMAGLSKGSISVAMSITSVIPDLLGKFLRKYPDVHFRQVLEPGHVAKKMLENGEVDLCLVAGEMEGTDIEWHPLINEEIYVVVPEQHHLAGQESVSLYMLKDEPFISLGQGYWLRNIMEAYCREAGFTPNIVFEIDEPDALVSLVRQGVGVFFAPASGWEMRSHLIPAKIKITDPECRIVRGIAWSRKHYLSKAAMQFRQHTIDYFADLHNQRPISGW